MFRGYRVTRNINQVDVRLIGVRIANLIGKPFGINPFPRAFPNPMTRDLKRRDEIFDRIYERNFWESAESRSGVGSEGTFTAKYRARLKSLLDACRLERFFDAPCGDLNWIASLARLPGVDYSGGDISRSLVSVLNRQFPDIDIRAFDICTDQFPVADVWHCRDCLFHLPFEDIRHSLSNFSSSSIPFALITTHRATLHRNLDVEAGGFRYLDLERAPIGLPPAEAYLKDYRMGRDFPRYVGLWRREAIAGALERWHANGSDTDELPIDG